MLRGASWKARQANRLQEIAGATIRAKGYGTGIWSVGIVQAWERAKSCDNSEGTIHAVSKAMSEQAGWHKVAVLLKRAAETARDQARSETDAALK
eukprot:13101579-Alexandrium_andersonii.AAC.1